MASPGSGPELSTTGFLSCSIVSDIYVFTQWKRTRGGAKKNSKHYEQNVCFWQNIGSVQYYCKMG